MGASQKASHTEVDFLPALEPAGSEKQMDQRGWACERAWDADRAASSGRGGVFLLPSHHGRVACQRMSG